MVDLAPSMRKAMAIRGQFRIWLDEGAMNPSCRMVENDNSGDGMISTGFEGRRPPIIHHAEDKGPGKPQLYEIDDSGDKLFLILDAIPSNRRLPALRQGE
jgi:hypothetical protein